MSSAAEFSWNEMVPLDDLVASGEVQLGRGNVISKIDIRNNPGPYPIYSSSSKNGGKMGEYGSFMFDEELISWSVDGGGYFFHRPKHKFSVTNVSGYMRLSHEWDYRFTAYSLQFQHEYFSFDYQTKAHPSVIREFYLFPKVTLPEQQKIATILSSVDDVIEKTRAQIDKLKDLKTGMMQELLTKGIGHTEFKNSAMGRVPKDWSVKTLGETATLQRGHDLTQANSVVGCYPVVSSSGVSAMHDEYTTQGPGVVVGRKGSIGRVHYIQSDFWAHDTSLYVTNFHGNDVLFIYQLFSWLDLQKYGTKSGSPSLNRNDLHPLKLALPPVAEQIEIRDVLMQVDERTSLLRRKLSHLTGLKKALMQDLLTGKVRVNVDQKEPAAA
ncbi:restriction endonuclease subunit S [Marinobacter sp.]|uniref:restriction endonuclease subunit S n=1 Tax=Marinobacter sp. TaxID=50741 RepID=UPI003B524980